jgi:hypothetical protein
MPGRAGYTLSKRGTAGCYAIGGAFWASRGSPTGAKVRVVTFAIFQGILNIFCQISIYSEIF